MVMPAVLSLHKHVETWVDQLKHLTTVARNLRYSLTKRFEVIFARLRMANSMNIETSPFPTKLYIAATILDPNFQLFWVNDLVTVEADDVEHHILS